MNPKNAVSICLTIVAIAVALSLTGCYAPPKANPLPDLYPSAMLVEPIKMRAGYVYTSAPIEVSSTDEVWEVSLGFARQDAVLPFPRFFCLLESRKGLIRQGRNCPNDEPGIQVRWEILRNDGIAISGATYDAIIDKAAGESSRGAYLVVLGALKSPGLGKLRVRLHVLRDFPELDVTNPQLVVNMEFFRRR